MATEREENDTSPSDLGDTPPSACGAKSGYRPPSRTGNPVNPKADENITMTIPSPLFVRSAGVTRGADVGLVEIVALEQERPAVVLGHGVGKAITEVELRGMAASFAIARKRRECSLCFLRSDLLAAEDGYRESAGR
jgi:hypothetical protein